MNISIAADMKAQQANRPAGASTTGFLIFDTESVPDGLLLKRIKYPHDNITPHEAIERTRQEVRDSSPTGSDFIPVTFQVPVAVCVVRVATDFTLQRVACLGAPDYHVPQMVREFWRGVEHYSHARLVTFNGRAFDLPLMELAAYDHGVPAVHYFQRSRNRFHGNHIDLMDWLSNYGAYRVTGGLNLLAMRAAGGRQAGCGKLDVAGDQVYEMYRAGKLQEINDYCLFDTLDTYFVFLRTRVMTGEFDIEHEERLTRRARQWLETERTEFPALQRYLEAWDRMRGTGRT